MQTSSEANYINTMVKTIFSVNRRKAIGKGIKQLRREMLVPGNVYGGSGGSLPLQFPGKTFIKLYDEAGETGLVYLKIEGEEKEKPTLISQVQLDPVTDQVLHVSFKEVDLKEKIEAEVPVEMIGEFDVREAVLVQVRNSIVVEALPADLPEKFEINIEGLTEIGQSITLADLNFDKSKVSLVEVVNDEDWGNPVVLVQEQRQEEAEEVIPEEAEVAVEGEGEGEAEGEGGGEGKGGGKGEDRSKSRAGADKKSAEDKTPVGGKPPMSGKTPAPAGAKNKKAGAKN
ncbi:50S ribosomal protein L25 [Patescibacteria group bacterium]|nr:50S ribosomal protein L25 [Patescibacteria group bacterium]MBU1966834.1 50S ribosomal protein L25 [Patescibacteria group bacterium]MBU2543356.1 50S ribosomal protein L25 [Patescibacteria group bacterium]